jgi:hypothetical protein
VTTIDVERAERVARAGAPYPYSSATEARKAHQRAAGRAFSRYLLWGYLVGVPGFFALFVPLAWRSSTALLILGGGVAALAVAAAAMVPLWKTIGRHRAVLATYGIATNIYGQVVPAPSEVSDRQARAARGLDLRSEARRALRIYRRVVALSIVLVAAFWTVAMFAIVPVDADGSVLAWAMPGVAVGGLALGVVLATALRRVKAVSAGTYPRGSRGSGVVVFILSVLMGGLCAALVHQVFVSGRATSITGVEWFRYGLVMVLLVVTGARWVRARRTLMRWLREMSGGGAPSAA